MRTCLWSEMESRGGFCAKEGCGLTTLKRHYPCICVEHFLCRWRWRAENGSRGASYGAAAFIEIRAEDCLDQDGDSGGRMRSHWVIFECGVLLIGWVWDVSQVKEGPKVSDPSNWKGGAALSWAEEDYWGASLGWGEGQLRTEMGLQGRGVAAEYVGSWQPIGSVLSHSVDRITQRVSIEDKTTWGLSPAAFCDLEAGKIRR